MAEETRSEQLAQKVTPSVREKLDEVLKKMGHYDTGKDGHIKWDQEVLEEIIAVLEEKYIMDGHDNYAEVVRSINQYISVNQYEVDILDWGSGYQRGTNQVRI